jgi:hypothetical protein
MRPPPKRINQPDQRRYFTGLPLLPSFGLRVEY